MTDLSSLKKNKRYIFWAGRAAIILPLLLPWAWGVLALFFAFPGPGWVRGVVACLFAAFLPAAFVRGRSFSRNMLFCILLFMALLIWWQTLRPTNNKEWAQDVAEISHGTLTGNRLRMYNVRNFEYNGANVVKNRWETRDYDLDTLQGLDLFLSYWASDTIAHTILSWDFADGNHLAVSIETRKDVGQDYSAVKGFLKQYELAYVAADENDIIKLRTNYRKERVFVYRLQVSKEQARLLLESYLREMNGLLEQPEFYDALMKNCTTSILLHRNAIAPDDPFPLDWRLFLTGHVDELLYERGRLNVTLPFSELREKSRIDLRMQSCQGEDYAKQLRRNLLQ